MFKSNRKGKQMPYTAGSQFGGFLLWMKLAKADAEGSYPFPTGEYVRSYVCQKEESTGFFKGGTEIRVKKSD